MLKIMSPCIGKEVIKSKILILILQMAFIIMYIEFVKNWPSSSLEEDVNTQCTYFTQVTYGNY